MDTESNTMTLEAMLESLDGGEISTHSDSQFELSGLTELEHMAIELEKLDTKEIAEAIGHEDLLTVNGAIEIPVIAKLTELFPTPVNAEEDDLVATLADDIITDTPPIAPIEPEVKIKPVSKKVEDRSSEQTEKTKKVTCPRFQLSDLTTDDYENLGVKKEAMTEAVDKCPVKAKDKALNLVQWALRDNELSIYTKLGIECLIKNNTASSEIFRIYMMSNPARPYPTATAGTQAGQLMAVLPALGIADRIGKNITLKSDSPLIKRFKEQFPQ